jgi:hypothetical protein
MREALGKNFGTEVVAVGGAFLVDKGSAWIHVMPDFPKEPFESLEAVDKWLHYYNMKAPLVCLSVFVSHDPVSALCGARKLTIFEKLCL